MMCKHEDLSLRDLKVRHGHTSREPQHLTGEPGGCWASLVSQSNRKRKLVRASFSVRDCLREIKQKGDSEGLS